MFAARCSTVAGGFFAALHCLKQEIYKYSLLFHNPDLSLLI